LTFILEVQPLSTIAEPLIERGTPWLDALRMMALTVPAAMTLTVPMSLLCGVLVALGRLSADSESRAMQACAIGPTRLLRPVLLLAVVFAAGSAYLGFVVVPAATTAFRQMAFRAITNAGADLRPGVFATPFPHQTMFFRNGSGSSWEDVFLADTSGFMPVVY